MEDQGQSLTIEARLNDVGRVQRTSTPLHSDFIRLVHWNIEKGKRWELLEQCLAMDFINSADIICLNEADYGMARSGNRHVAFEIAERLGMNVLFGPSFYEFTKGMGEERLAPGENSRSVQGNALLTRLAVTEYRNVRLTDCYNPSNSEERRAGGRTALIARVEQSGVRFSVAATHFEVLTTMKCRASQMRSLLEAVGPGPAIIAGDFNTNTFDRGSAFRTIRSLAQLLGKHVKERVGRPWETEPLFDHLRAAGFNWNDFNDSVATDVVDLTTLEDQKYIPRFVVEMALKRGRYLPLRLDWIACRGFRAVRRARTITDLPCEPSDHLPITCDIVPDSTLVRDAGTAQYGEPAKR